MHFQFVTLLAENRDCMVRIFGTEKTWILITVQAHSLKIVVQILGCQLFVLLDMDWLQNQNYLDKRKCII